MIRLHSSRHAKTGTTSGGPKPCCGKRLGIAVRRQVIIGCFIADFAALREEAIVEVDGGYHALRCGADVARDAKLRRLGWRVVRLPAEVVIRDLPGAVAAIRQAVAVVGG